MTRGRGNRRRRVPFHPATTGTFQPIKDPAVVNGADFCKTNGSVEKSMSGDHPSQYMPNAGSDECPQDPKIIKRDGHGWRTRVHSDKTCSPHNHHFYYQHRQTREGKESSNSLNKTLVSSLSSEDGKAASESLEYTPYMAARAKELKEEGNRRFQKKEYASAMDQYELALKLTPPDHPDRAIFHSNRAACLMQMKPLQYDAAIGECSLALQAHPGFPRALLRRARAFEATGKLDLALQDVEILLQADVSHPDAFEMAKRIRLSIANGGDEAQQGDRGRPSTPVAPPPVNLCASATTNELSGDSRALPSDTRSVCMEGEDFSTLKEDDDGAVLTPCPSSRHMQSPSCPFSHQTRTRLSAMSPTTPSGEVSSEAPPTFDSSDSSKPPPQTPPGDVCKPISLKNVLHQDSVQILQFDEPTASHMRPVKLIYDHDIRLAEMPVHCKFGDLRKLVRERFPSSKAILIKYKDADGDLVTITCTHDLRLAEAAAAIDAASRSFRMGSMGVGPQDQHNCSAIGLPVVPSTLDQLRLHVVEVSADQEPSDKEAAASLDGEVSTSARGNMGNTESLDSRVTDGKTETKPKEVFDQWLRDFAQLFRAHLGIDPNGHIDLHDQGMELCAEALEETASTEEAHKLFDLAASKFQEMAALGFLNWGNVYMCAARKQLPHDSNDGELDFCDKLQAAFDWAQTQYALAEEKFEQSLQAKPGVSEALLSLSQKDFESAKLHWSLVIAKQTDLSTWDSSEMLMLFCKAEETIQRAAEMLEKQEGFVGDAKLSAGVKTELEDADKTQSREDVHKKLSMFEQDIGLKTQVFLFWGNILYEHSQVEFRLGLPSWKKNLDAAVQRFEVAGASSLDITAAIEKHLSSSAVFVSMGPQITAQQEQEGCGLGPQIDRNCDGSDQFDAKDIEDDADEKCLQMDNITDDHAKVREYGLNEEVSGVGQF